MSARDEFKDEDDTTNHDDDDNESSGRDDKGDESDTNNDETENVGEDSDDDSDNKEKKKEKGMNDNDDDDDDDDDDGDDDNDDDDDKNSVPLFGTNALPTEDAANNNNSENNTATTNRDRGGFLSSLFKGSSKRSIEGGQDAAAASSSALVVRDDSKRSIDAGGQDAVAASSTALVLRDNSERSIEDGVAASSSALVVRDNVVDTDSTTEQDRFLDEDDEEDDDDDNKRRGYDDEDSDEYEDVINRRDDDDDEEQQKPEQPKPIKSPTDKKKDSHAKQKGCLIAGMFGCVVLLIVLIILLVGFLRDKEKSNDNIPAQPEAISATPSVSAAPSASAAPSSSRAPTVSPSISPAPSRTSSPTIPGGGGGGGGGIPTFPSPPTPLRTSVPINEAPTVLPATDGPTSPQPISIPPFVTNPELYKLVFGESSNKEDILITGSPQQDAYLWLEQDPVAAVNLTDTGSQQQRHLLGDTIARILQRFRLMVFYLATNGPTDWKNQGSFGDVTMNECDWESGVGMVIECGEDGSTDFLLTKLQFEGNNVTGELPVELGEITTLESLVIDNSFMEGYGRTGLTGGIPASFENLVNLEFLKIVGNKFTEALPDNLFANWNDIFIINLSFNHLPGSVPTSIANAGLNTLTQLLLDNNNFQGPISSIIGGWKEITTLKLSNNSLTGTVPELLGDLVNLTKLEFAHNELTGAFPDISALKDIKRSLDLSFNQFSGNVPDVFTEMGELQELLLKHSGLSGPMPSSMASLIELQRIDVSGAAPNASKAFMHGTLPDTVCDSINSQKINGFAYVDCLNGEITDPSDESACDPEVTVCCSCCECAPGTGPMRIRKPSASPGNLLPTVAPSLSAAPSRSMAPTRTASPNTRGGGGTIRPTPEPISIPSFVLDPGLYELVYRESLDKEAILIPGSPQQEAYLWLEKDPIADVSLTDTGNQQQRHLQSDTIARIMQRYRLMVFYYATNGPTDWDNRGSFGDVNVNECDWDAGLGMVIECGDTDLVLTTMEFEGNRVTGQLPIELGQITTLESLIIDNTFGDGDGIAGLTGGIPTSFANLVNLKFFRVIGNNFTQALPDYIFANWTKIYVINLSSNNLPGPIPASIAEAGLNTLQELRLDDNKLEGPISSIIGGWTQISDLWLSSNSLSGSIPEMLASLVTLQELKLSNNTFTGGFPDISALTALKNTLDFSFNQFSGNVPDFFAQMGELEELLLKDSGFTGPMPSSVASLAKLQRIDVSGAAPNADTAFLHGTLPDAVCDSISNSESIGGFAYVDCLNGKITNPSDNSACNPNVTVCCSCCQCAPGTKE